MKSQEIAEQVRKARLERGFTQKQLGRYLNKTASNISDIERGRVQVTAADLYTIAQALSKPIEYFYNEDLGDDAIGEFIAALRNQTPAAQKQALDMNRLWLSMVTMNLDAQATPRNEQLDPAQMQTFLADFFQFLIQYDQMQKQFNQARDEILKLMSDNGIDIASLLGNK